jgi:hypothetical protein
VVKRQKEEPPSGRIKVGLDSYVDPDNVSLGGSAVEVKTVVFFREHL